MKDKFIVAEASKNWEQGDQSVSDLLSERFELIINTNFDRGYKLVDWKVSSIVINSDKDKPPVLNETIIAIFEKTSL